MKRCDYCDQLFIPNGIKVTENAEGVWKSHNICNSCSNKIVAGETEIKPLSASDKLNLNKSIDVDLQIVAETAIEAVKTAQGIMDLLEESQPTFFDKAPCPNCDLTLRDFIENGKFGCSYCYEHYEEELTPILMLHQDGHTEHAGKVAKSWSQRQLNNPKEKRKLLLLKKAKAVELEQYEKAAEFAEEIRKLDDSSSSLP